MTKETIEAIKNYTAAVSRALHRLNREQLLPPAKIECAQVEAAGEKLFVCLNNDLAAQVATPPAAT